MTSGALMARWLTTSMQCKSLLCKVSPLCKAANLAWSEKPSSSWASAPRKSSSRMGVADAVVSTFHIVLFSGMDLVLPASRMFHQLRTSGACTASTPHHKGYPSSQGADSSQNATARPKVPPLITKSTGHKVPPSESSVRLAAETVLVNLTESVPTSS